MSAQAPIDGDLFCLRCQYNLRGLADDRCPECGEAFDRSTLHVSRIPWVHRDEIGRIRAYWRTVWFVTSRTSRFCDEMIRPVDYRAAQRFRRVTVSLAYVPFLALALVLYAMPTSPLGPTIVEARELVWPVVAVAVGVLLSLAAMTGIPGYFLQPRAAPIEQQNRAIALSYYACAPLAWLPLGAALAIGGYLTREMLNVPYAEATILDMVVAFVVLVGALMCALLPVTWLAGLIGLAGRLLQGHLARVWVLGFLVPLSCVVACAMILCAMLFSVGYVFLILGSLR
ncbi:MAG: hypothetical protein JXQ73_27830 [Phycisphaerae bacterium]|nr:hypothetical protein [Phycisphaerae bacterium]